MVPLPALKAEEPSVEVGGAEHAASAEAWALILWGGWGIHLPSIFENNTDSDSSPRWIKYSVGGGNAPME